MSHANSTAISNRPPTTTKIEVPVASARRPLPAFTMTSAHNARKTRMNDATFT